MGLRSDPSFGGSVGNNNQADRWITRGSSQSIIRQRKSLLAAWGAANDQDPGSLTESLRPGTLDLYESADRMVDYLQNKRHLATGTIRYYRGYLPKYFRFAGLGYDEDLYEDKVRFVKWIIETSRKLPEPQHVASMLTENRPPWFRALVSLLLSTGHRVSSVLALQQSDLSFQKVPVRARFASVSEKTSIERTTFLSDYSSKLVSSYLEEISGSQWVFPGHDFLGEPDPQAKQPLEYQSARLWILRAFKECGLDSRSQLTGRFETRAHSFRNLNLNIAKSSKYPPEWAEYLVSHSHGTDASYPGEEAAAKIWHERVSPALDKYMQGRSDWMPSWSE